MLDRLNKIRNSDFAKGIPAPAAWTWLKKGDGVTWRREPAADAVDRGGVTITSASAGGMGLWSQRFRCRKDQHYRVEALVSCACRDDGPDTGLVLSIHPLDARGRRGPTVRSTPLYAADRFTLRCYYRTTDATRALELRVGLTGTVGSATIHEVRVIPVLEPEYRSYPVALPPPGFLIPPPVRARTVAVVSARSDRPLVDVLRARFGPEAVQVCRPEAGNGRAIRADAVLIPDDQPPAACPSLAALKHLAAERIVIVSLPCFEKLSRGQVRTRLIRQIDDPLHARVVLSNFVTAGFALRDIFPFAGRPDHSTTMLQRQFRTGPAFRAFCGRHGFEVLLHSMADADATSDKPIALIHTTAHGALIVLDLDPVEAVGSSLDEPVIAAQLLLSALGCGGPALGQYTAPARTPKELRQLLADVVERFPELCWLSGGGPDQAHLPPTIGLGHEFDSLGLAPNPRPAVIIRSSLTGCDLDGLYAVLYWLKQLVRPAPVISPYATELAERFRVVWLPVGHPLVGWGGLLNGFADRPYAFEGDFEPGMAATVIDVTTAAQHNMEVATAADDDFHRLLVRRLPPLSSTIMAGRHFYRTAPAGAPLADRRTASWRVDDLRVTVAVRPDQFTEPLHRAAAAAGAKLIRITAPGDGADAVAHSIWRTDWLAATLEQVVGLLLGLVVVNRDPLPLRLPWPGPADDLPASAVVRRFNEPDLDRPVPRREKNTLLVPPAHAIVGRRPLPSLIPPG